MNVLKAQGQRWVGDQKKKKKKVLTKCVLKIPWIYIRHKTIKSGRREARGVSENSRSKSSYSLFQFSKFCLGCREECSSLGKI